MEKESNVVNLHFAYKPEVPRHIYLCETEAESSLDQIETTKETQHGVIADTNRTLACNEELEQICSQQFQTETNKQTTEEHCYKSSEMCLQ